MARTGRPRKPIDQVQFEKLCSILCTEIEIASFFEASLDTLNRWCKRTYKMTFEDIYKEKSCRGKISLRRTQFDLAGKGNPTMCIWLGKQILGQSEKITSVNKTELDAKIQTIDRDELRKANDELEKEC